MLYVTTRISYDAFTAGRALAENRGPEGGFFVPMQFPHFDEQQIAALADQTFTQNMAQIVNLLFGTNRDGWDLEFGIGRYPVKLVALNGKITVAESWHNPLWRFERLVSGVEKAIRQSDQIGPKSSDWLVIASRIAVLFGIYGQLMQDGIVNKKQQIDVAVPSADLSALMAVWYARSWGLPVGTIVCCCNENNSLWNLFHKGEIRTDALAPQTYTPDCDYTVPTDLERLIFAGLGRKETERFVETCRLGGTYYLEPEQVAQLRAGIYVSVVSGKRMASAIPNLYKTTGHIADPYTALAHSGLVDYRAATGESRAALILSEESPAFSAQFVAECMDISPAKLKELLDTK